MKSSVEYRKLVNQVVSPNGACDNSKQKVFKQNYEKGDIMNLIKTILLISVLAFLSACNKGKISNLEAEIADLKKELQTVTDPAQKAAVQKKLKDAILKKAEELNKKDLALKEQLKKTTDKESCEKLETQLTQLKEELFKLTIEHQDISFGTTVDTQEVLAQKYPDFGYLSGDCEDAGFVASEDEGRFRSRNRVSPQNLETLPGGDGEGEGDTTGADPGATTGSTTGGAGN